MARPKKEAFNRTDKRYEVKMTVGKDLNGRCIQKSFYSTISKDDAKKKGLEHINALEHGRLEETINQQNFAVWAKRWLEVYKKGDVKANSYEFTYRNSVINHLIPYFGKMNVSDIKASDVKAFFNEKSKTHSKETCKKIKMCLNGIFETAIDDNICFRNPCRNIKITDSDPRTIKSVYTQEEMNLAIEFAKSHRYGLDFLILAYTGIRRGELLALQWENVDLINGIIHIKSAVAEMQAEGSKTHRAVIGNPKNFTSIRDIPICADLLEVFNKTPREIKYGGNKKRGTPPTLICPEFVICTASGEPCSPRTWSRRHFDVFMDEMSAYYATQDIVIKKLNPHEIRHTFATLKYLGGMNLLSLAKILGHSDLNMLAKRYGHTDIEALRDEMETSRPISEQQNEF